MKYVILSLIVIGFAFYGCSPEVENVEFTEYTNRGRNNLWITVNTKNGLFRGRENFLSFTRHHYSFSMKTKSEKYTEQDMEITIYANEEVVIKPKNGIVNVSNDESNRIFVNVDIRDTNIPKFLNGRYMLSLAEAGANQNWYKMK